MWPRVGEAVVVRYHDTTCDPGTGRTFAPGWYPLRVVGHDIRAAIPALLLEGGAVSIDGAFVPVLAGEWLPKKEAHVRLRCFGT